MSTSPFFDKTEIEQQGSEARATFLDRVTADWCDRPEVRREFGSFAAFEAFSRHKAQGHIRQTGQRADGGLIDGRAAVNEARAAWDASSSLRMEHGGDFWSYFGSLP
jgi:hypothetical protein